MNTLSDVTLHIDENLATDRRTFITDKVRAMSGVAEVLNPDERPHLTVIRYEADKAKAGDILALVRNEGIHAELIGL